MAVTVSRLSVEEYFARDLPERRTELADWTST